LIQGCSKVFPVVAASQKLFSELDLPYVEFSMTLKRFQYKIGWNLINCDRYLSQNVILFVLAEFRIL
jgi:hypothetical protein